VRELVERSAGPLAACLGTALRGSHPSTALLWTNRHRTLLAERHYRNPAKSAATLHVCVTCLAGEDRETAPRAGRRLHDALVDGAAPSGRFRPAFVSSKPSVCPIAIAAAASHSADRGAGSYVYGDLCQASVDDLLAGASRYAATTDGLVPWRERPTVFPQGCDRAHPAIHLADTGASHVDRKSTRHDHHRFPRRRKDHAGSPPDGGTRRAAGWRSWSTNSAISASTATS